MRAGQILTLSQTVSLRDIAYDIICYIAYVSYKFVNTLSPKT